MSIFLKSMVNCKDWVNENGSRLAGPYFNVYNMEASDEQSETVRNLLCRQLL